MKVTLSSQLFSAKERGKNPFFLPSLFDLCFRYDHELVLAADSDSLAMFDRWQEELPLEQREVVELVLRFSAQVESREKIDSEIVASELETDWDQSPPRIGPNEVLRLLEMPLMIMVENEVNDGAFLQAMRLGVDGEVFLKRLRGGRILFDNGGGSSMKAVVEKRAEDPIRAHRMWVVFDSDALVPDQPSKESQAKIDACKAARIRGHRLQRRAIENYLPPDELKQSIPHGLSTIESRRVAAAFERLNSAQRAHYNLKSGFAGDEPRLAGDAKQRAAVDAHFAEVRPKDRVSLAKGFGRDVASILFTAGISEASRRRDGQDAEMVPLFRAILRWL